MFKIKTKFALNGNSLHQDLFFEMSKVHSVPSGEIKQFNKILEKLWTCLFPPEAIDLVVILELVFMYFRYIEVCCLSQEWVILKSSQNSPESSRGSVNCSMQAPCISTDGMVKKVVNQYLSGVLKFVFLIKPRSFSQLGQLMISLEKDSFLKVFSKDQFEPILALEIGCHYVFTTPSCLYPITENQGSKYSQEYRGIFFQRNPEISIKNWYMD